MSNGFDQDQTFCQYSPDLGSNCLQMLSTGDKVRCIPEAFYRVCTIERVLGYSTLYGARGEALWQKMVSGHSKGLK